ncbi:hypothetical protein D3C72_880170 [compost metagenome]
MAEIVWEPYTVNPGATSLSHEIEKVLRENELLITEWAPIHLTNMLKRWFWKEGVAEAGALDVWQKSCCYLYLPRLRDDQVFARTLNQGVQSKDFFGIAQGKEGDSYPGFVYGKSTSVILDGSCVLIEPSAASDYDEALRTKEAAAIAASKGQPHVDLIQDTPTGSSSGSAGSTSGGGGLPGSVEMSVSKALPTQFYASTELDPVKAKMQFATLVDEVIQQFTAKHGVNVTISIDIQASSAGGFDDSVQRSVKENCTVLKVNTYEFE